MKILVTGGAGYIGCHTAHKLKNSGYQPVVLDNLVYGHKDSLRNAGITDHYIGDIGDCYLLRRIFAEHEIQAVMHFSAYAYVGESVCKPDLYYRNNVVNTIRLLDSCVEEGIKCFVFSSSCATYGVAQTEIIQESHAQNPVNPYGRSKLMVEQILKDYETAFGLNHVILRYFNAAGADPSGLIGEDHDPETHLIPLVLYAALGLRENIKIFGTDYNTPDGSCIRDYIHVNDLAHAHILGMKHSLEKRESLIFNLGNGKGYSVREVIEVCKKITKIDFPVIEEKRRAGDPPILVGSSRKINEVLGWEPEFPDLEKIISHAWTWHKKRHAID